MMETIRGSWHSFNINHVITICSVLGLIATINESDTKNIGNSLDKLWHLELNGIRKDLQGVIKWVLALILMIKVSTKHLYEASYIVLIYSFTSNGNRIILPWLILSGIRSIFAELVTGFAGFFVCACFEQIKFQCLIFVITTGISIACSAWLWANVYGVYMKENYQENYQGRQRRASVESQAKSLDSILAEAVVDWFLEESERCKRFDSKLAFDEDIIKFDEELKNRAAKFLDLTPEQIRDEAKNKLEINKKGLIKVQNYCQTEDLGEGTSCSVTERIPDNEVQQTSDTYSGIIETDMETKNPLRKFPYLPRVSSLNDRELCDVGDDTAIGNKDTSVQTVDEDEIEYPSWSDTNIAIRSATTYMHDFGETGDLANTSRT